MANYEIGPQFTVEQNEDGTIKLINLQTLLFRRRARLVIDTGFRYLGGDAQKIVVHNSALNAGKFATVHEEHSDFNESLRITVIPCEEISLTVKKWSVIALLSLAKLSLATLKHAELNIQMQDELGCAIPDSDLELTKVDSTPHKAEEKQKVEHKYDDRDIAKLFKLLPDVCEDNRLQILEQMQAMRLKWYGEGMHFAAKCILKKSYQPAAGTWSYFLHM
jgi:hypothetical protein